MYTVDLNMDIFNLFVLFLIAIYQFVDYVSGLGGVKMSEYTCSFQPIKMQPLL